MQRRSSSHRKSVQRRNQTRRPRRASFVQISSTGTIALIDRPTIRHSVAHRAASRAA